MAFKPEQENHPPQETDSTNGEGVSSIDDKASVDTGPRKNRQELVNELIAIDISAASAFLVMLREKDHNAVFAQVAEWNENHPTLRADGGELCSELRSDFDTPGISVRLVVLTDGKDVRFKAEQVAGGSDVSLATEPVPEHASKAHTGDGSGYPDYEAILEHNLPAEKQEEEDNHYANYLEEQRAKVESNKSETQEQFSAIAEAQTFDELYSAIKNTHGIRAGFFVHGEGGTNSSTRYGAEGYLWHIEGVRNGERDLFAADDYGIRTKVVELLAKERAEKGPEPEPKAVADVQTFEELFRAIRNTPGIEPGFTYRTARKDIHNEYGASGYIAAIKDIMTKLETARKNGEVVSVSNLVAEELYDDEYGIKIKVGELLQQLLREPLRPTGEPTEDDDDILGLTERIFQAEKGQVFGTEEQLKLFNQLMEKMSSLPVDRPDALEAGIFTLVRENPDASETLLLIRNAPNYDASYDLMRRWNESVTDWVEEPAPTELINGVALHGHELVVLFDVDRHVKFGFATVEGGENPLGSVEQFVSDNGREFETKEQRDLYNQLNFKRMNNVPVEKLNELEEGIFALVSENPQAAAALLAARNTSSYEECISVMKEWNEGQENWRYDEPLPNPLISGVELFDRELVVLRDSGGNIIFDLIDIEKQSPSTVEDSELARTFKEAEDLKVKNNAKGLGRRRRWRLFSSNKN